MDEQLCVEQVLRGNTSAFSYFVETYQDMAMTIAYRICGNRQDAEDVVQESFVKAYRNLHSFRAVGKFSSWLYRIVYNTAITHSRTMIWHSHQDMDIENASEVAENELELRIEEKDRSKMIAETLEKMPQGDALLLTLYYMEDNSVKEIAKITGLNDSNVKVKLFRARKLFKELLGKKIGHNVEVQSLASIH